MAATAVLGFEQMKYEMFPLTWLPPPLFFVCVCVFFVFVYVHFLIFSMNKERPIGESRTTQRVCDRHGEKLNGSHAER